MDRSRGHQLITLAAAAILGLSLAFGACDDEPPPETNGECAVDGDCPTGSYCGSTGCQMDCQEDSDCQHLSPQHECNFRGRCVDGSSGDGGAGCDRDSECDDGDFCNGEERCAPDEDGADEDGCVPGAAPCGDDETCDEGEDRCVSVDCSEPDVDGDGHDAILCGGDDCDDSDVNRYPGNVEVCDDHDEDCDPCTVATINDGDDDMDGYIGVDCTNPSEGTLACASDVVAVDEGAALVRGRDCDDADSDIHPEQAEVCNEVDDNCDGNIDEDVSFVDYYPDCDGDEHGDEGATPVTDCAPPSEAPEGCASPDEAGWVRNNTDCDDTNASVNPGTAEVCNGVDDNCDGEIDEDVTYVDYWPDCDGDGHGAEGSTPVNDCAPPSEPPEGCAHPERAGWVRNATDCDDTNGGINPGVSEICNEVDDDCDGEIDEEVVYVDYYPDCDGDEHGDEDATPINDCAPPSGPPEGCADPDEADWVLNHSDCDDTDSGVNPSTTEVCNEVDDDCDGEVDERLTVTCYPEEDGDGFAACDEEVEACRCGPAHDTVDTPPDPDRCDCDDRDDEIHPDAEEIVGNEVDDDCDGDELCYEDADDDGHRTDVVIVSRDEDCDDSGEHDDGGLPNDCCDTDDQVYFRSRNTSTEPNDCGHFDYDCDDIEEFPTFRFPETPCYLHDGRCCGGCEGFFGDLVCGEEAPYIDCDYDCNEISRTTDVVPCG